MSAADVPFRADIPTDSGIRSERWTTFAAVTAVALACALQMRFGAFGDVSWMLTICEKWLGGGAPYVDFVETNPPAAIALYLPATLVGHALGVRPEATVVAFGLLCGGAALAYAAAILRAAGLFMGRQGVALVVAVAAIAILPGRTFDERDFFVALMMAPPLALWSARAAGLKTTLRDALACGALLGLAIAIKPPYGAIVLAIAPYLWARVGLRCVLTAADLWTAGGLVVLYAIAVTAFFPAYVHDVIPTLATAYVPVREPLADLLANAGTIGVIALLGVSVFLLREKALEPFYFILLLAALGALAAFFVQGKGWLYQALPAEMIATILAGLTLQGQALSARRLAAAAVAAGIVYALGALQWAPPLPTALLVAALAHLATAPRAEALDARLNGVAEMALATLVGALGAYDAMPFPGADEAFTQTLRALAPHPTIAAIAPGLGTGFPLTRQVDGVWIMRRQGMLMTAGARFLLSRHLGDVAGLHAVIDEDKAAAVADIVQEKPDAILVSRINPAFHDWALADPDVARALEGYRLIASNGGVDWPVDLYARADLIPLKSSQ